MSDAKADTGPENKPAARPEPASGPGAGPVKRLSPQPSIDPTALVVDSRLGAWTEVGPRTRIIETTMDDYSYAVNDCQIIYADIGKFCNFAAFCRINPGNHPIDRATLHHFTYRCRQYDLAPADDDAFFEWRRSSPVRIGHDVWLGHGVVVLPGRTIGTGAVVGAGSVVTRDVPPYTIFGGVPASLIRFRFPADVQAALLRIAWWDWSHELLKTRLHDFQKLNGIEFARKYDR